MVRALNTIFGIGTAVVIFILILLGIQAFYPSPQYGNYCNNSYYEPYSIEKCPDNITVGECRNLNIKENNKEIESCYEKFNSVNKIYNKNFFIIASIIGVVLLIISYFLFSFPNIAAGIAFAGIILILTGFIRGWGSTNDMLKFIVGIIIAIIVIFFSVKINKNIKNK